MSCREITKTDGEWPDLSAIIGAEVVSAELRDSDGALRLTFNSNREIVLPPPWQYSSCLLAVSSAEFESANDDPETLSELVGLCGAQLTMVEADNRHLDLILGSIRISVTHNSPP